MKKMSAPKSRKTVHEDMRAEYRLDYSKAKPNRFAGRDKDNRLVVLLDDDVAQVFTTPEAVNRVLRALITTMPSATVETRKQSKDAD
jgi:hypothetical protein